LSERVRDVRLRPPVLKRRTGMCGTCAIAGARNPAGGNATFTMTGESAALRPARRTFGGVPERVRIAL